MSLDERLENVATALGLPLDVPPDELTELLRTAGIEYYNNQFNHLPITQGTTASGSIIVNPLGTDSEVVQTFQEHYWIILGNEFNTLRAQENKPEVDQAAIAEAAKAAGLQFDHEFYYLNPTSSARVSLTSEQAVHELLKFTETHPLPGSAADGPHRHFRKVVVDRPPGRPGQSTSELAAVGEEAAMYSKQKKVELTQGVISAESDTLNCLQRIDALVTALDVSEDRRKREGQVYIDLSESSGKLQQQHLALKAMYDTLEADLDAKKAELKSYQDAGLNTILGEKVSRLEKDKAGLTEWLLGARDWYQATLKNIAGLQQEVDGFRDYINKRLNADIDQLVQAHEQELSKVEAAADGRYAKLEQELHRTNRRIGDLGKTIRLLRATAERTTENSEEASKKVKERHFGEKQVLLQKYHLLEQEHRDLQERADRLFAHSLVTEHERDDLLDGLTAVKELYQKIHDATVQWSQVFSVALRGRQEADDRRYAKLDAHIARIGDAAYDLYATLDAIIERSSTSLAQPLAQIGQKLDNLYEQLQGHRAETQAAVKSLRGSRKKRALAMAAALAFGVAAGAVWLMEHIGDKTYRADAQATINHLEEENTAYQEQVVGLGTENNGYWQQIQILGSERATLLQQNAEYTQQVSNLQQQHFGALVAYGQSHLETAVQAGVTAQQTASQQRTASTFDPTNPEQVREAVQEFIEGGFPVYPGDGALDPCRYVANELAHRLTQLSPQFNVPQLSGHIEEAIRPACGGFRVGEWSILNP